MIELFIKFHFCRVLYFITAADQSSDLSENLHRLRFQMSFDTFGDLFSFLHQAVRSFLRKKKRFVRSAHDNGNIRFSCGVFSKLHSFLPDRLFRFPPYTCIPSGGVASPAEVKSPAMVVFKFRLPSVTFYRI